MAFIFLIWHFLEQNLDLVFSGLGIFRFSPKTYCMQHLIQVLQCMLPPDYLPIELPLIETETEKLMKSSTYVSQYLKKVSVQYKLLNTGMTIIFGYHSFISQ